MKTHCHHRSAAITWDVPPEIWPPDAEYSPPAVYSPKEVNHGTGLRVSYSQSVWVNYNDLTATSLEIMVSKGNHPQMALIQVSEIL